MVTEPQDAPLHTGRVVRRVLLCSAGTSPSIPRPRSSSRPPSRRRSKPVRPLSRHAAVGAVPPPAASLCPESPLSGHVHGPPIWDGAAAGRLIGLGMSC